jgi:chromosome segregation ATPase
MESHTATNRQQSSHVLFALGCSTVAAGLAIVFFAAAVAPAESQIAELEPGPYSYQHAQLMADAQAAFGQRRPPAPAPTLRDEELAELCRHLDSLQEQIRQTEEKLRELNLAREPVPAESPTPEKMPEAGVEPQRPYEGDAEIAEMNQQRERLAERANQQTMELRELRAHVINREREIASELRDIHEQMQNIERQLAGLDRRRQEHLERLVDAQNRAQELEERLRDLMAEVAAMRQNVAEQIGQNHRQEEAIHNAIEQTRQQAQQVRDQLEEVGRVSESVPEPMMRRRPAWEPPRPMPAPPWPGPDPALQTELKLLREEVALLREQLREAPKRVEVVHVENPYAVGSARGYYWPCR